MINDKISKGLREYREESIRSFQASKFVDYLHQELINIETYQFVDSKHCTAQEAKQESINDVNSLIEETEIQNKIQELISEFPDFYNVEYQDHFLNQFDKAFREYEDTKFEYQPNLLFLTHDFDPLAYVGGCYDQNFDHIYLRGDQYLKYDYSITVPFENNIDYSPIMKRYLDFEKEIGEEKVDEINEALFFGYLYALKDSYFLAAFNAMNLCLEQNGLHLRSLLGNPDHPISIYASEHDIEPYSIYVL